MDITNSLTGRVNAANAFRDRKKFEKADRLYEAIIKESEDGKIYPLHIASFYKSLAMSKFFQQNWATAIANFKKSSKLYDSICDIESVARNLDWQHQAEWASGQFQVATRSALKQLIVMKRLGLQSLPAYTMLIQRLHYIIMKIPVEWSESMQVLVTDSRLSNSEKEQIAMKAKENMGRVQEILAKGGVESEEYLTAMIVGDVPRATQKCTLHFPRGGCGNPACFALEEAESHFKSCSKCKSVRYCSKACQVAHWNESHKRLCQASDQ
jgi:hypothetical protein